MGRRGPKTLPAAFKIARGNPGRRPLGITPKPTNAMPLCPRWLDDEAKNCWRRIAPKLKNMGVLSEVDGDALANYCDAWSRWKKATLFLQKNGDVYTLKDGAGNPKCVAQWPQVAIARNMVLIMNRYQQEFGLTPSARSRINLSPESTMFGGVPPDIAEWDAWHEKQDERRKKYDAMIAAT